MNLELAGEKVQLLSDKAIFWPAQKLLAFSDVHLGKPESLQAMGIPVPSGAHEEDLDRMARITQATGAEQIFILGDLIHQRNSWTMQIQEEIGAFFESQKAVEWSLLIGNHERGSKPYLEKLPLKLVEGDLRVGPFVFSHGHDLDSKANSHKADGYAIQGHVHPVIKLHQGSIRLRLPCFVMDPKVLTLPSFGVMTGGYEITKARKRRIFAVTPGEVFEVPGRA